MTKQRRAKIWIALVLAAAGVFYLLSLTEPPTGKTEEPVERVPPFGSDAWTEGCPAGMLRIGDSFCIDQYEYPNIRGGMPARGVSPGEARRLCSDAGKRLCTGEEWQTACRGSPEKTLFGGKASKKRLCRWYDYGPAPSGEHERCHSFAPVYDMIGNVWEWTEEPGGVVDAVARGGSWRGMYSETKCTFRYPFIKGQQFTSLDSFGFRCCRDAGNGW